MKKSAEYHIFNIISYISLGVLALFAVVPFIMLIVSSFASENYIINHGYTLIPKEFSLDAYKIIFSYPDKILQAYGVTIFITVVGTGISLFISSMTAYVLYRKEVKYKNIMAFFIYFTTLFNGGIVSFYFILTTTYKLKNSILVLLLVPMFSAFYIFMLRSFIKGTIPDSLIEAAKIDGAGDFKIFISVVLPLSKASLASIGLFTALGYWNDWWTPMLFIDKEHLFPLQYVLYRSLANSNAAANMANSVASLEFPKESFKLAITVVSVGPIILVYSFVQKYFVKGVTIGAVKG